MKIITIEEHVSDAAIAKACRQAQSAEAPYFTDWVQLSSDDPALLAEQAPHLVGAATASYRLLLATGEKWCPSSWRGWMRRCHHR
ncbi:TPA: hypothetical protein ACKP1B_004782 [Serratia fonticola]